MVLAEADGTSAQTGRATAVNRRAPGGAAAREPI